MYRGKVEAVFDQPGTYELKTDNIPFWTTITKILQSFESEYKGRPVLLPDAPVPEREVGHGEPDQVRRPEVQVPPVGPRAFGNYSFRIAEPREFFVNVVGVANDYPVEEFRQVVGSRIGQPLADFLATSNLQLRPDRREPRGDLGGMKERLTQEFRALGFEMADFRIEGTSFDDDTTRRIGRIADMSAEAQAKPPRPGSTFENDAAARGAACREERRRRRGRRRRRMSTRGLGLGQMMAGAMRAGRARRSDPAARLASLKKMLSSTAAHHAGRLRRAEEAHPVGDVTMRDFRKAPHRERRDPALARAAAMLVSFAALAAHARRWRGWWWRRWRWRRRLLGWRVATRAAAATAGATAAEWWWRRVQPGAGASS